MRRNWWIFLAIAITCVIGSYKLADAVPANPHAIGVTAPGPDVQLAYYYRGRYYGGRYYRWGGRYYGGVWYGTGRRWYGGRWWPYGVGSCWRMAPIGYVWVCG